MIPASTLTNNVKTAGLGQNVDYVGRVHVGGEDDLSARVIWLACVVEHT